MKTFWQHTNGLIYVVESDTFGQITGAAGPVDTDKLRDPSEYRCGPSILAWLKRSIVEHKLRQINPALLRDAPPSPVRKPPTPTDKPPSPAGRASSTTARLSARAGRPPSAAAKPAPPTGKPPSSKGKTTTPALRPRVPTAPVESSKPKKPPDPIEEERARRKKFAWSSAYRL